MANTSSCAENCTFGAVPTEFLDGVTWTRSASLFAFPLDVANMLENLRAAEDDGTIIELEGGAGEATSVSCCPDGSG